MSYTVISSATTVGLDMLPVEVEVNVESIGFPTFSIVGLADKGIEESKERVRSAIRNLKLTFPTRRITVNLAPAFVHKKGSIFDLAIALGILIGSGQLLANTSGKLFIGELALDGRIRKVNGVLAIALRAAELGFSEIFVPRESESEAQLVRSVSVYPVASLEDLILHLTGKKRLKIVDTDKAGLPESTESFPIDLSDVHGQTSAKRAVEISAAGGHNLALCGSPGSGKTLLSKSLPSILPKLAAEESLELTKIYSVCGRLSEEAGGVVTIRPFRSPHHSISLSSLVGGGHLPVPGEITLAHKGVLFLDEFTEMPRSVIEALRQPLEEGSITVSRLYGKFTFPSRFILVIAFNPCPCGYLGDKSRECRCNPYQITTFKKKMSGPVMDRIDLFVQVDSVDISKVSQSESGESSSVVRKRVQKARDIQYERFKNNGVLSVNSDMSSRDLNKYCALTVNSMDFLKEAARSFKLSLRAFHKVIKVARTIADLEGGEEISVEHLAEALQFRLK